MPDRIRTFIAIDFPVDPLKSVLDELADLGRPVRSVAAPLHLTLKFLGDTQTAAIENISQVVSDVCGDHSAFDVELVGVGAFPRRERPSVIWVGVASVEPLRGLAARLELSLELLGFTRESRPFEPHITLARVKGRPPRELADVFELYGDVRFGTAPVRDVTLYQSELTRQGPIYSVLSSSLLRS